MTQQQLLMMSLFPREAGLIEQQNLVPVEATVITPCHQVISDCLIIVIPDGCPRNLVYEQKSKLSYVQEGKLWYIEKEKNA